MSTRDGVLCPHCVDNRENKLCSIVKGKRGAPRQRRELHRIVGNIHPYVFPDYELLDEVERAFRDSDSELARQLLDLSFIIRATRTAQVFSAALYMRESDFTRIPEGIVEETDKMRRAGLALRKIVTDGLGLKVPLDLPIEQYAELVSDYRPRILSLTEGIIGNSKEGEKSLSFKALLETITEINREIERIKGLKRHLLLEAIVGFIDKNRAFTVSALVAGALGLGGSLVGCAGSVAAGIGTDIARKTGKLRGSKAVNRLGRKIHRDLEPSMNALIAKYVGSNELAVHVLSVRQQIGKTDEP